MANKQSSSEVINIGDTVVGTANTQLQFSFETFNIRALSLIFQSVGGNFPSVNATVEVSGDNSTWVGNLGGSPNWNVGLGTSNIANKRYYSERDSEPGSYVAVTDFPYVRVTVPALGGGISCVVTYGGKA